MGVDEKIFYYEFVFLKVTAIFSNISKFHLLHYLNAFHNVLLSNLVAFYNEVFMFCNILLLS